jgi:hypothetical protein
MLKITAIENDSRTTLVLEGKLVGPWVTELEKSWSGIRKADESRAIVIDLMDVTLISERGQELLRRMRMGNTTFNCCRGVHTKHLLKKLLKPFREVRWRKDGSR